MTRLLLIGFFWSNLFPCLKAQDTLPARIRAEWLLYTDAYYTVDFNAPSSGLRPPFTFNHTRDRELQSNLSLAQIRLHAPRTRVVLGLMAGTYSRYNLASETPFWQHVMEASAGYQLLKGKNLWLDAGVLPSHIGAESAIAANHPTLSRSMAAENSPYYETGIRLGYTSPSGKWYAAALLLNGWQHIRRTPGNTGRSAGTQLTYTPRKELTLNWSSFWGNDRPDSARQFRIFHNVYAQWQFLPRWDLNLGLDLGREKRKNASGHARWWTPQAVLRYRAGEKWAFAGRAEYYADPEHVIIAQAFPSTRFRTSGFSLTAGRRFARHFMARAEYKTYRSEDPVFTKNNLPTRKNSCLTLSLSWQREGRFGKQPTDN